MELITTILITAQLIFTVTAFLYFFNGVKEQNISKSTATIDFTKQTEHLNKLKQISLTLPISEKTRPSSMDDVIGQEEGIKALRTVLCGKNPQHVLIYGPAGVGKTAAARLVLEEAKLNPESPFKKSAKFIEIDATTLRFDERSIADPLIGSVHDPIYQGAGAYGNAGIPQPKEGAVTKAHGGVLFIDEIGELNTIQMNKLLKVLEDRKVFLSSAYYSSENNLIPSYIHDVFKNGLPADFRLIGATTRGPEEISPAIRSRCVEVFFKPLECPEIRTIASNAINKVNLNISNRGLDIISRHCSNGREVINLVQLCSGVAINEKRDYISEEDILWVIENGEYHEIVEKKVRSKAEIGIANGLAVHGSNIGILIEVEVVANLNKNKKGSLKISGIIEEEEISSNNRKMIRKSTAYSSIENVITVLNNLYNLNCDEYDIHISIPGGVPVDGPSAGITIAVAIYSAITKRPVNNKVAMTGEISILGAVKPVGGIVAKIMAASKAGVEKVLIPIDNYSEGLLKDKKIKVIPVISINEVIENSIISLKDTIESVDVLSAERYQ